MLRSQSSKELVAFGFEQSENVRFRFETTYFAHAVLELRMAVSRKALKTNPALKKRKVQSNTEDF